MKSVMVISLLVLTWAGLGITPAFATGDCSDYVDLTGQDLPIEVTGTTADATTDYGPFTAEPPCWQGVWDGFCAGGPDVTYKWTVPADSTGHYTISLLESDFAADLLIYDFTCPGEPIHPDNFICGAHRSLLSRGHLANIELTGGQEILIVVDGWGANTGEFQLTIHDTRTLERYIRMVRDVFHLPGVSANLSQDSELIWNGTQGLANIEEGRAVADTTMFLTMSACKPVTGTALMQLWEDRDAYPELDLDDDINEHLPFEIHHHHFPGDTITIRMLMCHVAGINDLYLGHFTSYDEDSPISLAELAYGYFHPDGQYYSGGLTFTQHAPGTAYQYSTFGIVLVGYLVECINNEGLTFLEFTQQNIFDPLGMTRTSWLLSNIIDTEDLAMPYEWNEYNQVFEPQQHPHVCWYAGGGLRTTAPEFSNFMRAIMQGGEFQGARIVEPATVDSMLTPQFTEIIPPGDSFGLTWAHKQYGDHVVWGHGGQWDNGASTDMFFRRDLMIGGILLTNSGGSGGTGTDLITEALLNGAVGIPTSTPDRRAGSPPTPALRQCYPNPFNPQTTIVYEIGSPGPVRLRIFDLRGRLISSLVESTVSSGRHEVVWNGRDINGRDMPSGVYLSRLEASGHVAYGRMALVR